ncbi:hypothetical protein, partial [Staphylococcus epidermidis]|uniref:hypothetical protein n=1 Tax=Staphylococcus epidermidis TaxID=1282 RepID=UPI001C92BC4D
FTQSIRETKYHPNLLLQVHHQLIFQIPKSQLQHFTKFLQQIIQQPLLLHLPLKLHSNYRPTSYHPK